MSVSLPGGGGGGRVRNLNHDLNLVPFIDLLTVCITFLIMTAVWTQLSSLKVDQAISDPNADPVEQDTPPVPPLTVHVRSDGLWMGRNIEQGKNYNKVGEDYDWETLKQDFATDREAYPEETQVVIVTDDGVDYEFMVKALDISRQHGYDKTLLGGGPASATASIEGAGAPAPG